MDFGFSNDPTAIETMCLAHGDLWVDELCYQTGLTNPDICRVLRDAHLTRNDLIIADSAEPKSIAEIRAGGFNVQPCAKGADSILNGIDLLRRYKIHITRRSVGVRDEVLKYKWQVDRDGNTLNKPIGLYDHAMDAIRYVAMARLPMRAAGRARAHIITN
jgi:phage terminase large subunit